MKDINEELIDFLRNGVWIDNMSPEENKLLANYLKNSMAKKCKKIAFAEQIKDGVVYTIYRVKQNKSTNVLSLVVPGEIVVHPKNEELPKEVSGLPKLGFSTLFCLGEFVNGD